MNRIDVQLVLRIAAVLGILYFSVELLANLLQSFDRISPSYLMYFFKQQLARPLAGITGFFLLGVLAAPLSRLICKGLNLPESSADS